MAKSQTSALQYPHSIVVPVASHRKWPDPVFPAVHHHSGYIPAVAYPKGGFPNDPNLRPPNIDRQIYKAIAQSLLNKDCTPNAYHLKSKGVVQAAAHVRELSPTDSKAWFEKNLRPVVEDDDVYDDLQNKYVLLEVTYDEGQGILDGGHTDEIWSDPDNHGEVVASFNNDGDGASQPIMNHLPIEWVTGVQDELVAEIVGGRNTAMQVQTKTLANHEQKFDWIKTLLKGEAYANKIAYRENESRADKPIDIRELLALIAPFNRDMYSLEGESGKKLPVSAFSQKQAVLEAYIDDQDDKSGKKSYCKIKNIFKDILVLSDLIHMHAVECYNKARKGRGGAFTFVDHHEAGKKGKAGKKHFFHFTATEGWDRLADGALYPLLGAFSALVTTDDDGNFAWATSNGFDGVKELWFELAAEFMELTGNKSAEVGRNPAQIGKSANHWEFLYLKVKMKAATKGW